ncbi:MAG: PD40 domain-containing protein [Bryobacterales bacterium]|nr:PD40 domain-containing protein [Bryobacterales bacterium]
MSSNFTAIGEPNCFAIGEARLANLGDIRWTTNRREIIFSPLLFRGPGESGVWTMPLPQYQGAVGVPRRFPIPSTSAREAVISRDGRRLVYSDFLVDADIWRLDLHNTGARPVKLITSTRFDWAAQYSPDGQKIIFLSRRSGHPALWVANSDGSNSTQLTTLEAPLIGSPRWSPDGQRLVFDSTLEKQFGLYVINADGSGLRRLTHHPAADAAGSWSHDGRWIYFVSTRSGERQIWKMAADGGEPIQITRQGGKPASFESPDGRFVYYTKSIGASTGASTLWRIPVSGGEEVKILDSLIRLQFTVTASGIYFKAPTDDGSSYATSIRFLSFQTGKVTTIAPVEGAGQPGVSVSPDGRFLLYSFAQIIRSDLMLVENFQ